MARTRIPPNGFTLLSLIPAFLAGYLYYTGDIIGGFFLVLVTALFDVIDGSVARATGKTSVYGKVLDHCIDRYAEFLLIGGIALGPLASPLAGFFAISGMVMASYVRSKAESEGAKNVDMGLMDRAEKLILVLAGSLIALQYADALEYVLFIVGALSHVTVMQRLVFAKRQLEVKI
jgi:archaetidylinositol phosphate synthase